MMQMGEDEDDDSDDEWEPVDHKSMWQRFGVPRVKHLKVGLNRWPIAYTVGGGLVLTLHLVMWYRNGRSMWQLP